jgi:isopentenyl phosphate kinase
MSDRIEKNHAREQDQRERVKQLAAELVDGLGLQVNTTKLAIVHGAGL